MKTKTMWGIVIAAAIFLVGGWVVVQRVVYTNSPEGQKEAYIEGMKKAYAEDTYGGKTPEETLRLFTAAIKKGDIDLAVKYFPPEDREKQSVYLKKIQKTDNFKLFFEDVGRLRLTSIEIGRVFFTSVGKGGFVDLQVIFVKNQNNVWKIYEI